MKCVILIDHTLPLGLIANTAAVLAVSIGKRYKEIVGEDLLDGDQTLHRGITSIPLPVLKGEKDLIWETRKKLLEMDQKDLYFVDFCSVAQTSKTYDEYKSRLENSSAERLDYLGIALCGPEKVVSSLTGNIALLR
jgi:hypothetical protein